MRPRTLLSLTLISMLIGCMPKTAYEMPADYLVQTPKQAKKIADEVCKGKNEYTRYWRVWYSSGKWNLMKGDMAGYSVTIDAKTGENGGCGWWIS